MSVQLDFNDGLPPMDINVIRSKKNIVVVDVEDLESRSLTWGAKGVYAYSKSIQGAFKMSDLYAVSMENKEKVLGYVEELIALNLFYTEE